MKKHLNFQNIIFYSSILISLGTIITLFSTFNVQAFGTFFSTDTLYLPSINKDILIDNNSLKGWHLNPSPNIFPDMIVYFIIMAFTSDFVISSFLFALIQYLFFIYLIFRLFKTLDLPEPKLIASLSNLLMLLFFMVSFYSNDFGFTYYLVSNSYHTGAFIMSLLCIILTLEYLKHENPKTIIYLTVISTLCVLSDRLFIVLYTLPTFSLFAFYFRLDQRRGLKKIMIANVLSTIIGLALFLAIRESRFVYIGKPHRIMDVKYITECFQLLMNQMWVYIKDLNFKSIIVILSTLTFVLLSVEALKLLRKKSQLLTKDFYTVLCLSFVIIVFFAPVINGNYTGFDTLRYNIYVFYILIIHFGITLYFLVNRFRIHSKKILYNTIIILIIGASLNIIVKFSSTGLNGYFNYYPKMTESIDSIAKKEKLHCGLGNYWNTKVINMFSKNGVKVFTSLDALTPWFHVMNENWYKNSRFNFILSDNAVQDSLINNYFNGRTKIIEVDDIRLILTPEFRINMETYKIEIIKK